MFKNLKIGVKITLGFVVMLVLLAFVTAMGFTGLRQVGAKVAGVRMAKDATITILQARRDEKNFIMRGGQDYVDKVAASVKSLNALVSTLASSGLSAEQLSNVSAIRDGTKSYENAFAAYVAAQLKVAQSKVQWRKSGEGVLAALDAANRQRSDEFLRMHMQAVYFLDDRSDDQWKTFQTSESAFKSGLDSWLASGKSGADGQRLQAMVAEYENTGADIRKLFQQQAQLDSAMVDAGRLVIDSASKLEVRLDSQMKSTSASSVLLMLVSAAGALALGILLSIFLTRGITKPLRSGVEFAQIVAGGDFSRQLDVKRRDEVGILAHALNDMSVRLRDMVATIKDSAQQVAASSEQISASSQSLAEGAQGQASTLEETSASMEELTASVDQVSEHAQSQAAAVEQGSSSMAQVQKSIDEISQSMTEISGLAAKSVENAQEGTRSVMEVVQGITLIAESSEKIGSIVTVISDIADQTNLLALNASIEAARAGEHGRGFAVVAEEVSKLADRSSTSTKEIEVLIKESVKNVARGVEIANGSQGAMEQIRGASQKVKDMIVGLTDSMQQQVSAIKELAKALENVSEMSQSISAATEQQSVNSKQVSKAVESVNELTQSAASSAEEMSSSSEELSGMAQELQHMIEQFKIEADGDQHATAQTASATKPPHTTQAAGRLVAAHREAETSSRRGAFVDEISKATNAHTQWFFHLQNAIKTGAGDYDPSKVVTDNNCEFGKWMYGPLAAHRGGTVIYEEIKDLHAQFHRETGKILDMALRGDKEGATKLIAADSKSKQLSGGLVMKLMELKAAGVSAAGTGRENILHEEGAGMTQRATLQSGATVARDATETGGNGGRC
jgi:methyl-accepting chemotaxis protein